MGPIERYILGWIFLSFNAMLCFANALLLGWAIVKQIKTKWRTYQLKKKQQELAKEQEKARKKKEAEKMRNTAVVKRKSEIF